MNVPFMNNNTLRYECTPWIIIQNIKIWMYPSWINTKTLRYECTLHE